MKTNLRIVIIGLICLTLGVVIGFFTAGRITKKRIHQKVEMQQPPRFKSILEDKLDLTPAQQDAFDNVFKEHMGRMQAMDKEMFEKRKAEFDALFSDLKQGLDEAQMKKLERFAERFKSRKHRPRPEHPPRNRE